MCSPSASVPAQMFPSRSSISESTDADASGSVTGSRCTLPATHRASPPLVPIHKLPSRSLKSAWIRLPGISLPAVSRAATLSPCNTTTVLLLATATPPFAVCRNSTPSLGNEDWIESWSSGCLQRPASYMVALSGVATHKTPCPSAVTAVIAPAGNPVAAVASTNRSSSSRASPWSVQTHKTPFAASTRARTPLPGSPSLVVNAVTLPSFHRASPSLVPIHSAPSRLSSKQRISFPGSAGLELRSKT